MCLVMLSSPIAEPSERMEGFPVFRELVPETCIGNEVARTPKTAFVTSSVACDVTDEFRLYRGYTFHPLQEEMRYYNPGGWKNRTSMSAGFIRFLE